MPQVKVEVCAKCLYTTSRVELTSAEQLAEFLRTDHGGKVVSEESRRRMHADPSGRTWCEECWGTSAARDARRASKYVAIVGDARGNSHERDTARRRLAELPPVVYTPRPKEKQLPHPMEQFLAEWHRIEKAHKERMREIDARFRRRMWAMATATALALAGAILMWLGAIGSNKPLATGGLIHVVGYLMLGVGFVFQQKPDWGLKKMAWATGFVVVGAALACIAAWIAVGRMIGGGA